MPRTVEISVSDLTAMIGSLTSNPCSTAIPGGEPEALPPDPEGCQHWIETVYATKAADLAIDRALSQSQIGGAFEGTRTSAPKR
jgi:hypothetical protein